MTRYGYFLSSEENSPRELVRQARLAEEAGFDALWISDHYHPWLDEQGESSFVWSVIGAISQVTSLPITTAVTCPLLRTHPAIVAQAAATSSLLASGQFTLGVGSGEALNEHILGTAWPSAEERLDMLAEAVDVIRELFSGRLITHHGTAVFGARLAAAHLHVRLRRESHQAGRPAGRRLYMRPAERRFRTALPRF